MSAFKVGQRVRIISSFSQPHIVGCAATIVGASTVRSDHWLLDVDGIGRRGTYRGSGCIHGEDGARLRPLTDPGADTFIASVKSWGPLKEKPAHIDLIDSVLAYIRGGSL